jgi:hypothetical protein
MSNETHFAENVNGNQVFNVAQVGTKVGVKVAQKASARAAAKAAAKIAAKASKKALKVSLKGMKAGTRALGKAASSKAGLRAITVAGTGITAYYVIAGEFGLGTQFMDNLAGLNCDEKAKDAGYEEGTDEYTKAVEECQQSAGDKLMYLGYGSMAIVGGLILLFALKKTKKKSDDSEE